MLISRLGSTLFGVLLLTLASFLCYSGLASNVSLLGNSPSVQRYFQLSFGSYLYLVLPLFVGAACSPFIGYRKLPWISTALTCIGVLTQFTHGDSFALLIILPFNILTTWSVCVVSVRALNATSTSLFSAGPLLALVVGSTLAVSCAAGYAIFTDKEAERRAQSFCATVVPGEPQREIFGKIKREAEDQRHLRRITVLGSANIGDKNAGLSYQGVDLVTSHVCEISFSSGAVIDRRYRFEWRP